MLLLLLLSSAVCCCPCAAVLTTRNSRTEAEPRRAGTRTQVAPVEERHLIRHGTPACNVVGRFCLTLLIVSDTVSTLGETIFKTGTR